MKVPDVQPSFEAGALLLEDAGFTVIFSLPDSEASSGQWENDAYTVAFETSTTDEVPGASYVVTAK